MIYTYKYFLGTLNWKSEEILCLYLSITLLSVLFAHWKLKTVLLIGTTKKKKYNEMDIFYVMCVRGQSSWILLSKDKP